MHKNIIRLMTILTFAFLTACGGGGDSSTPAETGTTNATPASPGTTPGAASTPPPSPTPSSPASTFTGTYTGRLSWAYNGSTYSGPMNLIVDDNNIITGTWIVTRGNTIDPNPTKLINLTGSVSTAGVLSGNGTTVSTTGSIMTVLLLQGNINKTNGTATGTYLHHGYGVADGVIGSYTGTFSLTK
jgi:hypothetical protein